MDELHGLNPMDKPIARLSQTIYACMGKETKLEQWLPPDVYTETALARKKQDKKDNPELEVDEVSASIEAFLLTMKHT